MYKKFIFGIVIFSLSGKIFSQVIDRELVEASDKFSKGFSLLQEMSYEPAIEIFLNLLNVGAFQDRIRYFLGTAFYKLGYMDESFNQWRTILQKTKSPSLQNLLENMQMSILRSRVSEFHQKEYIHTISLGKEMDHVFPSAIFVDEANRIFFLDRRSGGLMQMGPSGKIENSYSIATKFPYELLLMKNDAVDYPIFLISDFGNNRVILFDTKLRTSKTIFGSGKDPKPNSKNSQSNDYILLGPKGLTEGPSTGTFYVSDSANCTIKCVSLDGSFLFSVGKRGSAQGELLFPSGIFFDKKLDRLYVADRGNNRIAVFDSEGNWIRNFGEGKFKSPARIGVFPGNANKIVISDDNFIALWDVKSDALVPIIKSTSQSKVSPLCWFVKDSEMLYVSGYQSGIDVYLSKILSRANLSVLVERFNLGKFPRVSLDVSVLDAMGKFVRNLDASSFSIWEGGMNRYFELEKSTKRGLNILVFLEKSQVMKDRLDFPSQVIIDLNSQKHKEDRIWVDVFSYAPDVLKNSKNDQIDISGSFLSTPKMSMGISLQKMSDWFSHPAKPVGPLLRKSVYQFMKESSPSMFLFVCSQGYSGKDFLPENFEQIAYFAKNNYIPIFVLYVPGTKQYRSDSKFKILERMAEITGGDVATYREKNQLLQVLKKVREAGRVYKLSYLSFRNDLFSKNFRKIQVKANYLGVEGEDNFSGFVVP